MKLSITVKDVGEVIEPNPEIAAAPKIASGDPLERLVPLLEKGLRTLGAPYPVLSPGETVRTASMQECYEIAAADFSAAISILSRMREFAQQLGTPAERRLPSFPFIR